MSPLYDPTHREFYLRAWAILVEHAGAPGDASDAEDFVRNYTEIGRPSIEYRFCGKLGFGGKFYRNTHFYISYYPEDRTPEREAIVAKVNALLASLAAELSTPADEGA